MEASAPDDDELKLNLESEKPLCRCCLSTEKRMFDATKFNTYFIALAGINVSISDGVPQWICFECRALLLKAVTFKYKMLRAQNMLYEYLTRCAPFPIDAQDPELSRYASPQLCASHTLAFDAGKGKLGFHKVLQHDKQFQKSDLDNFEVSVIGPPAPLAPPPRANAASDVIDDYNGVKAEHGFSDFDDDLPLEDFRSAKSILNDLIEPTDETKTEPEIIEQVKKKKKRSKEVKSKKRKKSEEDEEDIKVELPPTRSIRKPIEIDPKKIKEVILNPDEQIKQREVFTFVNETQESKASLKFPYQCNLCFKGFNFESKLQNHMSKHSPSRGPFECKLCTMFLPTSYSFNVHNLIHTRRYECLKCGRRMIDRASIVHHYRTQHEGITTMITCNLCGKVSSNNKTHRGHMRNHHSGERPKCDQCGKSFVNKDSLTEHMQIHEGVKNYECSVCGKRCRTRTQIKHHQLKHTNVKEYYCVECDVRFKTAHSLRQHLTRSIKHKDVSTLKHACHRCDKRYDTARALEQHVLVQHEGVRAHGCAACGATLASRTSLHKHNRTVHAGRRPAPKHVCHTCGKAFRGKSVLVNHIRTHTGEKPFPCEHCGRKFSQRTAMRTHVKLVHLKRKDKSEIKPELPPPEIREPKLDAMFPKEEPPLVAPQVVFDGWNRPCDVFYVTAGP